jgi:hypothetical protein
VKALKVGEMPEGQRGFITKNILHRFLARGLAPKEFGVSY